MHQHLRQIGAVRLILGLIERQLHRAVQASRIFGDQQRALPRLAPRAAFDAVAMGGRSWRRRLGGCRAMRIFWIHGGNQATAARVARS
jgi:hypothetical protein